jgi:predicted Zn-dependent protease
VRGLFTRSGAGGRCRQNGPAALLLSLVLSSCAELPALRQASLPNPTPPTEAVTPAQREHQRILSTYGGAYDHPRLAALADQVVEKLVTASERPDLRYKVTILNSPTVNAFALPNGQLYVTRGLLALANDTSELASVLSHEMAHVIARHAAIREDQIRQAALISRVATDVFKDPQMSALMLARSKLALAGFSRAQEFEADGIGVGIAARAGFDPFGSVRFLTNMGRNAALRPNGSGDPRFLEFLSSHPATPDRIKNALANARQYSAPGTGERDKAAYLAALDGMTYGEDPSEGFVRGRRFLHPRLGFTFTAPEGFVLDNTAQAVLGVKEGSLQALRLDVVRIPPEQSLADYLRSGWIEGIEEGSIEELTVNGLPAATAIASGEEWTFRLHVVRLGGDVYRFVFATKVRTPEIDRSFREAVATFRRMTAAEIRAARPLRIKVVTVAPGDTVERLAGRMVVGDRPLERFLVLNGLEPGATLKAGDKVKIVVE